MRVDFAHAKFHRSWCGPLDPQGKHNKVKAAKWAEYEKTKKAAQFANMRTCMIAFFDAMTKE